MDEIKEEKVEDMRIENRVQFIKVYLGGGDDYITVSGNDISLYDRFLEAGNKIISLANKMDMEVSEIDKKNAEKDGFNEISEIIGIRKRFSAEAAKAMDGVFGEGTTRKFFGDVYAAIPDFLPDAECFMDFWDSLIPVIERLSEHKAKLEKLASKQRMAKYKPKDHKRPGGK